MAISATYVSASQFTVSGDHTDELRTSRMLLCDCGVDGTFCGAVASATYSGGTGLTTCVVTLDSGVDLTSNLTEIEIADAGYADSDNDVSTLPTHSHTGLFDGGEITNIDSLGPQVPALSGHGYAFVAVNSSASALTFFEVGSANQVLGMDSGGTDQEWKTLAGTSNQVTVTHGTGTITFSTPQNIHTSATPEFQGLTLSSLSGVLIGNSSSAITDAAYDPEAGSQQRLIYSTGGGGYQFREDTSNYLADADFSALSAGDEGSIAYVNSSGNWVLLAPGTDGQVLTLASGVPTWATP